jgi:oxaloacetate decarboxylase (Na+ extruding) subunit gamma
MTELMSSGIELMFAGMGIVFLFLTMLVGAITVMSRIIERYFPEEPVTTISVPVAQNNAVDKSYIAAITAAVHQYRNSH